MKRYVFIIALVMLFCVPAQAGYYGSWKVDDYVTFTCNTHDPSDGSASDADAVPAYRVYEDDTGTAILTGNMALFDDANTTGFYYVKLQLTAANGFEKGKHYSIYIAATVSSVTGTVSHNFQIEAEVDANTNSGNVTVATNNDKTGYALADSTSDAVIAGAVWDAAVASYGAAGTYGLLLETDLDATISSRSTLTAANVWETNISAYSGEGYAGTYLDNLYDNQDWNPWDAVSRTLTALDEDSTSIDLDGTQIGSVAGAVGSVSGAVGSISGITFPTHFGDLSITETTGYVTYANAAPPSAATISSQVASDLGTAHGAGSWETASGFLDAAGVRAAIGLSSANLDTQLASLQTDLDTPNQYKAAGFSTHSAADVLTAFGTGSTLTACLTATGFSTLDAAGVRSAIGLASANLDTQISLLTTSTALATAQADLDNPNQYKATGFSTHSAADVKTTIEAAGSSIASILEDTGTTLPAAIEGIGGGTGANAITIHVQDSEEIDISDVTVEVWNSDSTVYYSSDTTDAEGNTSFSLDDGDYDVRCRKAGVSFTVPEEITVSEAETFNITGSTVEVGIPTAANACRVYEYCYQADGSTPCTSCSGTAKIVSLPHDSGSMLHSSSSVNGTYDSETGMIYWDIVQGATVLFRVVELGIQFQRTIPSSSSARLIDIE